MTQPPLEDLLDPSDPDWASFQNQDPDWFLSVAGTAIRTYCGWHIYPSLTVTEPQLTVGARGMIMLPSRYVTAVDSVVLFANTDEPWTLDPATDYVWFQGGWIEQTTQPLWGWNYYGSYYYGPDGPSYPAIYQAGFASVTFTHGYDAVPDDIKEVAYELALSTTELRAGNVKEIQTQSFRLQPAQHWGATLTADQRNRLANYRIGGVI